MAAVTGTVLSVSNISTVAGPKATSAGADVKSAVISVKFSGTYASADDSSTANVHTALASALRSGKTIALKSAAFVAPGSLGGAQMYANTVATSTNTMTAQLLQADFSTEWADGALATFGANATDEGVKFLVTFTET